MDTKICTKCGVEKSVELFRHQRNMCKDCHSIYNKNYCSKIKETESVEEKELRNARFRKNYKNRMENLEYREKLNDKAKAYISKKPIDTLLSKVKYRAKKRNLECDITRDDIVIPEKCPVFHTPLIFNERNPYNIPSVD